MCKEGINGLSSVPEKAKLIEMNGRVCSGNLIRCVQVKLDSDSDSKRSEKGIHKEHVDLGLS